MDNLINMPRFNGEPREVAEVWTLRKGSRVATCYFWTHPTRAGESRVVIDGELWRSEALADGAALLDLALSWKEKPR